MAKMFLLLVLLLTPLVSYGFGKTGHQLICALAWQQLSADTRQWATDILNANPDKGASKDFIAGCLWPDESKYGSHRSTYEQHFINIEPQATKILLSRDCLALDCLPVGIQRNMVYLQQTAGGKREQQRQAEALMFLGHYIGDLHQPLHVSHAQDWGGNRIRVQWFGESSNLHAIWDSGLLEKAGLSYPGSLSYLQKIRINELSTSPHAWMTDAWQLALNNAYRSSQGEPIKSGDKLADDYFQANKPVIMLQIALAGQRLAWLLNQLAAGKPLPVLMPENGSQTE
ncbi:MAG: hypothetical protein KDI36_15495 [Pseudomonadales bacterium]|nr:hypothetical protein [Pseudomonadales bacterium]